MRKVVIHKPGGYQRLCIETAPDLVPGPGEILIEVLAAGVNYADCVTRMGLYASARHYEGYPMTPGFEVAGVVAALGESVAGPAPGSRVLAVSRFNAYASQVVVPQHQVYPLPAGLSAQQAAGLPAVFLTAWFALFELAHPHAGDQVLVHSAAGGVGGALVQLAGIAGCDVVGVVGAAHKVPAVEKLGAGLVIDKSGTDWRQQARRYAENGFHVILDANGVSTLRHSYQLLAPTGKLVVYGFHSMLPRRGGQPNRLRLAWDYVRTPRFNPFDLTTSNHSVLGFNLSYLFERHGILRRGMQQLLDWQRQGLIQAPRTTCYALEDVASAHRDLESGQTVGKLVLQMQETG